MIRTAEDIVKIDYSDDGVNTAFHNLSILGTTIVRTKGNYKHVHYFCDKTSDILPIQKIGLFEIVTKY